jgi:hypothetical protein
MYGREHGSDSLRETERKKPRNQNKVAPPKNKTHVELRHEQRVPIIRESERESSWQKRVREYNKIIHTKTMFRSSLLTQPTPTTKEARKRL